MGLGAIHYLHHTNFYNTMFKKAVFTLQAHFIILHALLLADHYHHQVDAFLLIRFDYRSNWTRTVCKVLSIVGAAYATRCNLYKHIIDC